MRIENRDKDKIEKLKGFVQDIFKNEVQKALVPKLGYKNQFKHDFYSMFKKW